MDVADYVTSANHGNVWPAPKIRFQRLREERQLMQRYATSTNVVERRIAANVLFGTALQLGHQGRSDLALDVYDEVLRFFDGAIEGDIEELVAASRFNQGNMLGHLGRSDEALTAYNTVIAGYAG